MIIYEEKINFRDKLKDITQKEQLLLYIKENRIVAYFQPIVDSKTYKPYALECLARIIDENNKILPAGMFIDIAIETVTSESIISIIYFLPADASK
ncbi:MAG TPA: EAL domain-containing protein [Aquificae bacterium]|nr:EAL domain-containing protein [Aquificota bacterium]